MRAAVVTLVLSLLASTGQAATPQPTPKVQGPTPGQGPGEMVLAAYANKALVIDEKRDVLRQYVSPSFWWLWRQAGPAMADSAVIDGDIFLAGAQDCLDIASVDVVISNATAATATADVTAQLRCDASSPLTSAHSRLRLIRTADRKWLIDDVINWAEDPKAADNNLRSHSLRNYLSIAVRDYRRCASVPGVNPALTTASVCDQAEALKAAKK